MNFILRKSVSFENSNNHRKTTPRIGSLKQLNKIFNTINTTLSLGSYFFMQSYPFHINIRSVLDSIETTRTTLHKLFGRKSFAPRLHIYTYYYVKIPRVFRMTPTFFQIFDTFDSNEESSSGVPSCADHQLPYGQCKSLLPKLYFRLLHRLHCRATPCVDRRGT